jgi:hypothetical protein
MLFNSREFFILLTFTFALYHLPIPVLRRSRKCWAASPRRNSLLPPGAILSSFSRNFRFTTGPCRRPAEFWSDRAGSALPGWAGRRRPAV